jgi:hypothetical protein
MRVLVASYDRRAGSEILLRALLAEQDGDAAGVLFWLRVYDCATSAVLSSRARI